MSSANDVFTMKKEDFSGIDVVEIMVEIEKKAAQLPEPDFSMLTKISNNNGLSTAERLDYIKQLMNVSAGQTEPTGNFIVKLMKRLFRKLTFWYVEPAIFAHTKFNQEVVALLNMYEMELSQLKNKKLNEHYE